MELRYLIGPGIAILLFLIGGAVMWGRFKTRVENQEKRLDEFKDDCRELREECQEATCKKIDELKGAIHNADGKREKAREDYTKEIIQFKRDINGNLKEIAQFTGRVEEFMNQHRGKFQGP